MPIKQIAVMAMLCMPGTSQANGRADELKRCLGDFGGIEWKLPYQPPVRIVSCAGPTMSYGTAKTNVPGRHILELIGELTLGPGPQLPSDENYAALQHATLTHFDALLRRHGFRQVAAENGNARTVYPVATQRMLQGLPVREDEPEPEPGPPIPYVSTARYARSVDGREQTLTFATGSKNTWRITLDGAAAGVK